MKKLKKISVVLLFLSVAAFIVFRAYLGIVQDHTPPVLSCEEEELRVTVEATTEELLQGVTAMDDRSGDVSDTLVIESMSDFTNDGTRMVTYAAVDDSGNVGRCERTVKYVGYQPPTFHLSAPLSFPVEGNVDIFSIITADSVLDGDLTFNIKYSLGEVIDIKTPGSYPIEFRVMDSGGTTVYLKTQVEIYERDYAGIDVILSDYLVYVAKGSYFDSADYYVGADQEGTISIRSDVNTGETGTYFVDYIVSGNGINGKSRLTVVVQ